MGVVRDGLVGRHDEVDVVGQVEAHGAERAGGLVLLRAEHAELLLRHDGFEERRLFALVLVVGIEHLGVDLLHDHAEAGERALVAAALRAVGEELGGERGDALHDALEGHVFHNLEEEGLAERGPADEHNVQRHERRRALPGHGGHGQEEHAGQRVHAEEPHEAHDAQQVGVGVLVHGQPRKARARRVPEVAQEARVRLALGADALELEAQGARRLGDGRAVRRRQRAAHELEAAPHQRAPLRPVGAAVGHDAPAQHALLRNEPVHLGVVGVQLAPAVLREQQLLGQRLRLAQRQARELRLPQRRQLAAVALLDVGHRRGRQPVRVRPRHAVGVVAAVHGRRGLARAQHQREQRALEHDAARVAPLQPELAHVHRPGAAHAAHPQRAPRRAVRAARHEGVLGQPHPVRREEAVRVQPGVLVLRHVQRLREQRARGRAAHQQRKVARARKVVREVRVAADAARQVLQLGKAAVAPAAPRPHPAPLQVHARHDARGRRHGRLALVGVARALVVGPVRAMMHHLLLVAAVAPREHVEARAARALAAGRRPARLLARRERLLPVLLHSRGRAPPILLEARPQDARHRVVPGHGRRRRRLLLDKRGVVPPLLVVLEHVVRVQVVERRPPRVLLVRKAQEPGHEEARAHGARLLGRRQLLVPRLQQAGEPVQRQVLVKEQRVARVQLADGQVPAGQRGAVRAHDALLGHGGSGRAWVWQEGWPAAKRWLKKKV